MLLCYYVFNKLLFYCIVNEKEFSCVQLHDTAIRKSRSSPDLKLETCSLRTAAGAIKADSEDVFSQHDDPVPKPLPVQRTISCTADVQRTSTSDLDGLSGVPEGPAKRDVRPRSGILSSVTEEIEIHDHSSGMPPCSQQMYQMIII